MSRRIWAAVSAVLVVTLLASTAVLARNQFSRPHKTYTFYLIPGVNNDPFYVTMHLGAQAEAKQLHVNLIFQGPAQFEPALQEPILNAAVARHPDAILIAPTDKTALIAPIRNAINAGVPVETVDTFITAPIAFSNVSSDNIKGGKKAAVALARALNYKGETAIINVKPGISTTDQRQQGFVAQIKKYKHMKYDGVEFDNDSATTAASETSALLTAHPKLNGIFAANLFSGEGVTNAVKAAGKIGKVKLVEFDAEPDQVAALKTGEITALVAQDPYSIGTRAVMNAYKYVTGHRAGIKKHYGTGEAILTKANINNPAYKRFIYKK